LFLRGYPAPVEPWVIILNAADNDPLRAQEIEEDLSQYWWERYLIYRKEQSIAQQEEQQSAMTATRYK